MPSLIPDRDTLRIWSRDRTFLLRATAAIMALGVILGTITWLLFPEGPPSERTPEFMMEKVRYGQIYWAIENDPPSPFPRPESESEAPRRIPRELVRQWLQVELERLIAPAEIEEVLSLYTDSVWGPRTDEGPMLPDRLRDLAEAGVPFAHEAVGDLLFRQNKEAQAIEQWEAELDIRTSDHALGRLMEVALVDKDPERLRELSELPGYIRGNSAWDLLRALTELREYGRMLSVLVKMEYGASLFGAHAALAFFVALVWIIIVGQFAGFKSGQLLLYGAAIFLGMFSATLTLFVLFIQNYILGSVQESKELIDGLIFAIAGIGLREELLKFLCFLPLVPILRKRGRDIEALVVAGFVGLGFALNENLGYYQSGGNVAPARFLTANFFHLAATAWIGYDFYRMTLAPRTWDKFLSTFLIVVVAHGLYDAVLMVPDLMDFSIAFMIILALLTYRFLDTAENLRPTSRRDISPLGIFVVGAALIVAAAANVMYFTRPPWPDYVEFLLATAGLLPVAFIFINRFRNV